MTKEEIKEAIKAAGHHPASAAAKELREKLLSGGDSVTEDISKEQIKEEVEAVEEAATELEYDPIKFKVDPTKVYEFRMTKPRKAPKNLPREATAWDDKLGRPRNIRYSKTEISPYVDEQDETAQAVSIPVVWKNGVLKVPGSNEALIRYLLAHDGFAGKQKVVQSNNHIKKEYYLYEPDKVAKAQRERRSLELQAQLVVEKASEEELYNFMRSHFNTPIGSKGDALYARSYDLAKQDPTAFVKNFNNPIHKLKVEMEQLFIKGLVSEKAGTLYWTASKSVIYKFNPAATKAKPYEVLARWVLQGSEEAKAFRQVMLEKTEG